MNKYPKHSSRYHHAKSKSTGGEGFGRLTSRSDLDSSTEKAYSYAHIPIKK